MNFFKSVFSDDPEPSDLNDPQISKPQSPNQNVGQQNQEDESIQEHETDPSLTNPNPNSPTDTTSTSSNSWSFGGLIKTITSKSETVIQTYKRDLEEFGSGLKMETVAIREAASRAVKDLPASIEVGASKAHGSLESVTHVIDEYGSSVWRGTSEIITLGKDALLSGSTDNNNNQENVDFDNQNQNFNRNSKKYNRFEANVNAIQNDKNTYLEQPDDLGDFEKWKLGFDLEGKGDEIENLLDENGIMEGIYSKIVPKEIDGEVFWTRYFYRVYKLKQVEDARANLVKRATLEEDEDLSWDVDDDGSNASESKVDDSSNSVSQELEKKEMKEPEIETKPVEEELQVEKSGPINVEDKSVHVVEDDGGNGSGEKIKSETNQIDSATKSEENVVVVVEEKNGSVESSKSSEFSVIPSEKSMPEEEEEEDLGWDEIEDVGSGDEKKVSFSGNPNRAELQKRLSTADEDEDLSWDIEDDDEPIKH